MVIPYCNVSIVKGELNSRNSYDRSNIEIHCPSELLSYKTQTLENILEGTCAGLMHDIKS